MVSEMITALALSAAALGAVASTIQGYKSSNGENYSVRKLTSALISSVFFAFGMVNIAGLQNVASDVGLAGLVVSNALLGYGIDKAHAVLDK
ncbi:MAG: hypothetical protein ACKO7N_03160 [Candidatus Nitrosotenuis sp.]